MQIVDTDVLIDHFHNVRLATEYIANTLVNGEELFISTVSVAETLAGQRAGEEETTEALFSLFTISPVDETVVRTAGAYLNQFAHTHHLDLGDALIAATAKSLGAELVTRNAKHYPMKEIAIRVPYERGRK